ncbi:MAG TPA: TetR/AcrR family transcriptional regulator [Pseudomonas sp.]|nr:TetR/AcrR family transcriptional regulator [Pseudomonas sp.]
MPSAKPLKRPTQQRAKATVQAIFDTYVRIWQRDGWARLTTRAVSLEAGVAIGTLYDYFPNKHALHSGYVRYCVEQLLEAIDAQAVAPTALAWPERIRRLVRALAGVEPQLPWFHPDMLELETLVAEPKHQRRAYEGLLGAWHRVIDVAIDLPVRPSAATLEALHLSVWGGRRYAMLVQLEAERMQAWAASMEHLCLHTLMGANEPA